MGKIAFVVPTLCRDKHFINCIESLKCNSYADKYDVFIGLDFPKNEAHVEGYNKIVTYLESGDFSMFNNMTVIKRNVNYGANLNEVDLLEKYIFPNYEMWCRTDDDVVFSKNYLEYMYKSLTYYKDSSDVFCVTGYSYPCNYVVSGGANVFLQNSHVPMWGVGFWRNKYLSARKDILERTCLNKDFNVFIKNDNYKKLIDARFIDFVNAGTSWNADKLAYTMCDVSMTIYCCLKNKTVVYPVVTKARNNGFDGTGVTCQVLNEDTELFNMVNQEIDQDDSFEIIEDTMLSKINRDLINDFDFRASKKVMKARIKLILYRILGERLYKKIWFWRNACNYKKFV